MVADLHRRIVIECLPVANLDSDYGPPVDAVAMSGIRKDAPALHFQNPNEAATFMADVEAAVVAQFKRHLHPLPENEAAAARERETAKTLSDRTLENELLARCFYDGPIILGPEDTARISVARYSHRCGDYFDDGERTFTGPCIIFDLSDEKQETTNHE